MSDPSVTSGSSVTGLLSLGRTAAAHRAGLTDVLPVYLSERVASEVTDFLADQTPNEGICKIYGFEATWNGYLYARVTDWFAGAQAVTPVTATFTDDGLRELELARADRYPDRETRPLELGVAHSHPFGHDPVFSGVDVDTFTTYPYGAGNVHLLIDPTAGYFKVFVGVERGNDRSISLEQVPWGLYAPNV